MCFHMLKVATAASTIAMITQAVVKLLTITMLEFVLPESLQDTSIYIDRHDESASLQMQGEQYKFVTISQTLTGDSEAMKHCGQNTCLKG